MQLREIMSTNVETIASTVSIRDAAQKMEALDIGALPVIEGGHAIGFITDRDITVRSVARDRQPKDATVKDIMTPGIELLRQDENVEKAAQLMEDKQIRRLAVADERDNIIGIVSLGDLARNAERHARSGAVLERISQPA